jgi:hypothetical protein
MPMRDMQGFNFEVKDSRDEIRLAAEPSRRNGYTAVVLIRDRPSGEGRYHFRLSWAITGGGFPGPDPGPPRRDDDGRRDDDRRGGFRWNDTVNFRGEGRGTASSAGFGSQRLFDASVDIDRRGRIVASFRAEGGRTLTFSGAVVDQDRGRIRADVASDDRELRVRGPMFISVDDRRNINSITFEGGDGRDRLRLTWDRR